MLLDLNKLHGPREHVERTLRPSAVGPDDPDYRVTAPVELFMVVSKVGADAFEAIGRVKTRLELSCGRCLEPYELPVDAPFELRYVPHRLLEPRTRAEPRTGDRGRRPDDRVLPRWSAGHRRPAARAVSAGAADETVVQRRVPRAVCAVRRESESYRVRVRAGVGRSPARAAQEFADQTEGELRCPIPNAGIRRRARRSAARTTRSSRCSPACVRSARKPNRRTRCARTAATTTAVRSGRSKRHRHSASALSFRLPARA